VPGDDLFGPLFAHPDVDAQTGTGAWLQAMLDAERALAIALARTGLAPEAAAAAIAACCSADRFDAASLGERALATGNPVPALVDDLRALVPPEAARYVHAGATSQDILDTAMMLVASRALRPILADLDAAAGRCAELARQQAATVMAGRTLLQQALPVTFGLKCAGWLAALDESTAALRAIRDSRLASQLGGAAGTLASLGDAGTAVARLLAQELGLAEPVLPWHANRARVAELGCALAVTSGALAKIAMDVLLLAQTEVAEAGETGGTRHGGSSTLPHKRNPVAAVLVTACAKRVPGLAATLLAGLPQEHERGAGGWHAEWDTVSTLLRLAGGAARHGRTMLAGLRVDAARMRANLGVTGGLIMAESMVSRLTTATGQASARSLLTRLCAQAAERGQPLRAALLAEPAVTAQLSAQDVDAALDPESYLGCARQFIDRALAAHAAVPDGPAGLAGAAHGDGGEVCR
jgi:3-carboxy-cis,cis-muconate cycloisomerase